MATEATNLAGYPGSKGASGVAERIIREMPPHRTYVELFAGHAAIFRKKKPADYNVLVDIDPSTCQALTAGLGNGGGPAAVVFNADAFHWLRDTDAKNSPDTLIYADPPYLADVRTRLFYSYEFETPGAHASLIGALKILPCKVILSGYWSNLYATLLAEWRHVRIPAMTRGGLRQEFVWCNFPEPDVLHDPRWAGRNFRDRERIKRKRIRWTERFKAMPAKERQVICQALADADPATLAAVMRSAPTPAAVPAVGAE